MWDFFQVIKKDLEGRGEARGEGEGERRESEGIICA